MRRIAALHPPWVCRHVQHTVRRWHVQEPTPTPAKIRSRSPVPHSLPRRRGPSTLASALLARRRSMWTHSTLQAKPVRATQQQPQYRQQQQYQQQQQQYQQPHQQQHQHQQQHMKPRHTHPQQQPYAPGGAPSPVQQPGQGDGNTFVSRHFRIDEHAITQYLDRKNLKYRDAVDKFTVMDCPFCHEIGGKADNQYKLSVWKQGGGHSCVRCQSSGSWFDFKRKLGDITEASSVGGGQARSSSPAAAAARQKPPVLPDQKQVLANVANLDKFPEVVEMLTGTGKGQRGLHRDTLKRYMIGATTHKFPNKQGDWESHVCVTFPWTRMGNEAQPVLIDREKLRSLKAKGNQRLLPAGGTWGMFGFHSVPASATSIVITEGEYDAMAVYQATGLPAVSLPNGASSLPVQLLPCLERFKKVYLWMDADQPGQDGAEQFAKKLGVGRTLLVKGLPDGTFAKDANEALLKGMDLNACLANARPLPHEEILQFDDLRQGVYQQLADPLAGRGVQSKWLPGLNKLVKGHRRGELTVFTGPTGVGKTTVLSQLSIDYCSQGVNTLWGSFEIKNERLARAMLTQHAGVDLRERLDEFDLHADRFAELPLYFLKFFGSTSVDQVLDAMEYAIYVNDVQHIVLDNLQFMLSGQQARTYDKFEMQDRAIEKFRQFATRHNAHVTVVIHPRKEQDGSKLGISSVFGGAKATQEADNVMILQHGGDPEAPRKIEIKKNRFDGTTGELEYQFDKATNRVVELQEFGDEQEWASPVDEQESQDARNSPPPADAELDSALRMNTGEAPDPTADGDHDSIEQLQAIDAESGESGAAAAAADIDASLDSWIPAHEALVDHIPDEIYDSLPPLEPDK